MGNTKNNSQNPDEEKAVYDRLDGKVVVKVGVLGGLFNLTILWLMIFTFLWNWDPFWYTDYDWLNEVQEEYFSEKYQEEQKKLAEIRENDIWIRELKERVTKAEEEAKKAEKELLFYSENEERKCDLLKSAMHIIREFHRSFSPDDVEKKIRCETHACKDIMKAASRYQYDSNMTFGCE